MALWVVYISDFSLEIHLLGRLNRANWGTSFYFYILLMNRQSNMIVMHFPIVLLQLYSCSWLHPQDDLMVCIFWEGGRSINPWFRSADNKLLLIKCSATYKLKPQFSPRTAKFKVGHKRYRWVDGKWALDWCVCERKAVKASLKRSFQQERRQILWNNQLKGEMEGK